MGKKLIKDTEKVYRTAEREAVDYLRTLQEQVSEKSFVPILTKDFQIWKQQHIHRPSLFSFVLRHKKHTKYSEYRDYIHWLDRSGKLDDYLNRSISYIYLRDLGKDLSKEETQSSILYSIDKVKEYFITNREEDTDFFSMARMYQWAQRENIEPTIIWLLEKIKYVSKHIPDGMDADQAKRKIIKLIAGVIMHVLEDMDDRLDSNQRAEELDRAIRLGYSYGLTYPFIDDLLDAHILTSEEELRYTHLIRTTLTTGSVPDLGDWAGDNVEFMTFLHAELGEAFEYIKAHQQHEKNEKFYEQSYLFFQSQELDRKKDLAHPNYTNEELLAPIILKSAAPRLIIRSLINAEADVEFDKRTFYYGLYNQLADDFADMFDDLEDNAVTPYTYYMTYHNKRSDLNNPFELYWAVIYYLIHHVYHSDRKTCEVILTRAINGLRRFKEKHGTQIYKEVMDLLTSGIQRFNHLIQKMVNKADDIDFFDKLLRDEMINELKKERKEQEDFLDTVKIVRSEINDVLKIEKNDQFISMKQPLTEAANYSLAGDGKRLRPVMAWFMGVKGYKLDHSAIVPLLRSLEYMHTASLIYDDLPSQDNASLRRGRSTIHQVHNVAIAELTGLFLTQKAFEEQTTMERFDPKKVLQLIKYSAQKTTDLCQGQIMDLDSKGKLLTPEELRVISHYKTGIALEASLLMPAILASADEVEKNMLKKFAYHAGIMFQVKDDLLDIEGDPAILGKSIGKDADNQNSTYVSVLGITGAKEEMWNHYCQASEAIQQGPHHVTFLKHFLNYMIHRDQ